MHYVKKKEHLQFNVSKFNHMAACSIYCAEASCLNKSELYTYMPRYTNIQSTVLSNMSKRSSKSPKEAERGKGPRNDFCTNATR